MVNSAITVRGLRRDAIKAVNRGLQLFKTLNGKVVEGLVSKVQGLEIVPPWLVHVQGAKGHHLHWLRAQGITMSQFRPIVLSVNDELIYEATVHSLTMGSQENNIYSKAPEQTAVYKAATNFVAGDRGAKKGWACSRCVYLSICENRP